MKKCFWKNAAQIILTAAAAVVFCSCANMDTPDEITVSMAGRETAEVGCGVGDAVVVTLETNPSTGYGWDVSINCNKLVVLESRTIKNPKPYKSRGKLLGAPVEEEFVLRCVNCGLAEIVFKCVRPWENKPALIEKKIQIYIK